MRIIFDENVPRPLLQVFDASHQVQTVGNLGYAGVANGALLSRLEGAFDVLLTADKNLRYQQNLVGRSLAIVELPTNRLPILLTVATQIVSAVISAAPGSYTQVPLPNPTP